MSCLLSTVCSTCSRAAVQLSRQLCRVRLCLYSKAANKHAKTGSYSGHRSGAEISTVFPHSMKILASYTPVGWSLCVLRVPVWVLFSFVPQSRGVHASNLPLGVNTTVNGFPVLVYQHYNRLTTCPACSHGYPPELVYFSHGTLSGKSLAFSHNL